MGAVFCLALVVAQSFVAGRLFSVFIHRRFSLADTLLGMLVRRIADANVCRDSEPSTVSDVCVTGSCGAVV